MFVRHQEERLKLLKEMWGDPRVQCYNDNELPRKEELSDGAVILLGPTSRKFIMEYNWRCLQRHLLRRSGFKGWIYVPEPRGKSEMGDFTEKGYAHWWESSRILAKTTKKSVWVPREGTELLGLNTNLELGILLGMILAGSLDASQVFIGWPQTAERMGLPNHYAAELAKFTIRHTLEDLCSAIVSNIVQAPHVK